MSNTDQPDLAERAGGFVTDATVDTGADGFIDTAIDDVASHVPGGSSFDAVIKTGVDLQANTAINAELGNLEGMLEHKD